MTAFINDIITAFIDDKDLVAKTEVILNSYKDEPLFEKMYTTPQAPVYHAEGPFVRDHIHFIILSLQAILDNKWSLLDTEEFVREKNIQHYIENLEMTIKENSASLLLFALCHDLGKPATIQFSAKLGSRGESLGFQLPKKEIWKKDAKNRDALMESYNKLYKDFAKIRKTLTPVEIQAEFFLAYQINIHYPGHGSVIFDSEYRTLFHKVADALNVNDLDREKVLHIIHLHIDTIKSFRNLDVAHYETIIQYAKKQGFDGEGFVDLTQATLCLDAVCGSVRRDVHGMWHDAHLLVNFFASERAYSPRKHEVRINEIKRQDKKRQQIKFQDFELDGDSIMSLIGMKSGRKFGETLSVIQGAALGKWDLPAVPKSARPELLRRVALFQIAQQRDL